MAPLFSIRNKLIFFFFIIITGSIGVVGGILYVQSTNIIKYQTSVSIINNLRNATVNIDAMLKTMNNLSAGIILNEQIVKDLQKTAALESYDFYQISYNINKALDNTKLSNSSVDSVYIYSSVNDYFFMTDMNGTMLGKELKQTQWFQAAGSRLDQNWRVVDNIPSIKDVPKHLITSFKRIKNATLTKDIGLFSINIDEKNLRHQFDKIKPGQTGIVYVLDSENRIISHPKGDLIGTVSVNLPKKKNPGTMEGYFLEKVQGRTILVSYMVSDFSGWTYIAEVPFNEIIGPVNQIKDITVLVCAIAILLAMIYSVIISNNIFHPVRKLVEYMHKAGEGDLNANIPDHRRDEFGILYKGFNSMVDKTKTLIDELYVQQLIKKEIQLKMIQSQLNPHFLYNTLDAIHWAAREYSIDEACNMTFELSNYFRKTLSDGKDIVTVAEASDLTRSYIYIQRIRYEDKFDYRIEVDEELLNCKVLKYIFQPIVENAIHHGIEGMMEKGHLEIAWKKRGKSMIEFTVEDNGRGITPEKLLDIKESLREEEMVGEGNFALKNVNTQIKLFYGEQYSVEMSSAPEAGTVVKIAVPMIN